MRESKDDPFWPRHWPAGRPARSVRTVRRPRGVEGSARQDQRCTTIARTGANVFLAGPVHEVGEVEVIDERFAWRKEPSKCRCNTGREREREVQRPEGVMRKWVSSMSLLLLLLFYFPVIPHGRRKRHARPSADPAAPTRPKWDRPRAGPTGRVWRECGGMTGPVRGEHDPGDRNTSLCALIGVDRDIYRWERAR